LQVNFFFRRYKESFNSIEEVFKGIIEEVSKTEQVARLEVPEKSALPWPIWKNTNFARKNQGAVNHITGDVHYLALGLGKNTVLTIHDIGSGLNGNWLKQQYFREFWLKRPANNVGRITVISETSKKEVEKQIPFAKEKISVIHNPFRKELLSYADRKKYHSSAFQILLVGTKPNKNLVRILQAVHGLDAKFFILGKLAPAQRSALQKHKLDFKEYFNLPYEEVIQLYLKSSLLCFPSTYEGFGMPIIEAQVLGVPVITSNFGAMKEVAADSACLVDPYSVESIREGIIRIMNDETYRNELIRRGKENVGRFEPQKIAQQYMQVYREVAAKT